MDERRFLVGRFAGGDQEAAKNLILNGLVEHWGRLDPTLNQDLDDIEDVLYTIARHILATTSEDPELLRMLLYSSLEGFRGAELLFNEFRVPYITYLREELSDRIERGELRQVNPRITARCFVGLVMDCAVNVELWNNLDHTSFSTEEVVSNNVPVFAQGLRKRD